MLLSALDLSPIPSGATASVALANTIDLARHVEGLGFTRYWLAEHHNAAALASSSPEIMIATVAARTTRIRVGSGGIMLPNHSALKVAEVFRVLSALHPGRIDLGVGRAAGTDPKTALALRRSPALSGAEGFPAQLDELTSYLTQDVDPAVAFNPIKAVPIGVEPPPIFLLGSSPDSARSAGERGLGFAFAHHISAEGYEAAFRAYRETFRPSRWASAPHAILAVGAICAGTEEEASELARCADLAALRFGQGLRDLPLPSVEEARAYTFDADEETFRASWRGRAAIGSPERVKATLDAWLAASGADELMVTAGIHDHAARRRSYERIAAMFGLRESAERSDGA